MKGLVMAAPTRSTASEILCRIGRHRKKAFLVFSAVMAGAVALALFLPRTYRSDGKLLVRLGRENATLDSTATPGQEPVVAVPPSREAELNSIVEVLGSRGLLEQVVDALGPDAVLEKAEPTSGPAAAGSETSASPAGRLQAAAQAASQALGMTGLVWPWSGDRPDRNPRELAIQTLARRISVAPVRRSNVVAISCLGPSPAWSQAMVAKLMDLYLLEHGRLNRTPRSLAFFTEQAERARQELTAAEGKLQEHRAATGLISPPDQRKALADRASRLQEELLGEQTARVVCEAKLRHLRQELARLPQRLVSVETQGFGNEGTDRMREQLYALRVRREEAAAKYTPEHPAMQQIEEQLAAAQEVLNHQAPTRTQTTTAKNPLVAQAEEAIFDEEHTLATCQARIDALQTQLAASRQSLEAFSRHEMQLAKLQRDFELKQTSYRAYATSLEQARVDQALGSEHISNLSIAQAASYEPKAVRPNKLGVLAAGLLLALLGAAGVPWAAESRDRRLRRPDEIEREIDLPLLGTIPAVPQRDLMLAADGNGHSAHLP
jgi:uncharacterized protein involved in exopolysaccharide biosynthesis